MLVFSRSGKADAKPAATDRNAVAARFRAVPDPSPTARVLRVTAPAMAGPDVVAWQEQLKIFRAGALPKFGADGLYGSETQDGTRAFQRDSNEFASRYKLDAIAVDGSVGPQTRTMLARRQLARTITPTAPAMLRGDSPLPGMVPTMHPRAHVEPSRGLAAKMTTNLLRSRPGSEDRELVRSFQVAHRLKPSGFYNVQTALALISHGFVPPRPYYWGRDGVKAKKRRYNDRLRYEAAKDPVRAPEWRGGVV